MKHFTTKEWIDFVNRVDPPKQQEAMKEHLSTGCKRCMETVALWQKVHNTAAAEASYQPSPADVRIAKAAFTAVGRATQLQEKSGFVEVLFDSFLQPMLAGAPSPGLRAKPKRFPPCPHPIAIPSFSQPGR